MPRAVLALPLLVLLLAGCVPTSATDEATATRPGPTPSPTASSTAAPSAAPTATAAPEAQPIPLSVACDQLVSAQELYDYNPNFSPAPGFSPAAGSSAATAVSLGGTACSWAHQSNGETFDISAAQLTDARLATAKADAAASGTAVSTFGVEGYFGTVNGTAVAQAFSGPYWITVASPTFVEPQDAAALVSAALAGVG